MTTADSIESTSITCRCSGVRALNTGVIVLFRSGVFGRRTDEGPEATRSDVLRFREGGVTEEEAIA